MATLVCFHAHPDDESISTGGTMAKAAAAGHKVVLVVATRGELGEVRPGVLDEGEALWERRVAETRRSGEILGVSRIDFLGYEDSGMIGESSNENPASFWQANLDEAADRLGQILNDVGADVLTIYDDHGNYGHPDHIQVNRVGRLASDRAGTAGLYEATMNRTWIAALIRERLATAGADGLTEAALAQARSIEADTNFGSPESIITHAVDVSAYLDIKRRAMEAHASQIGPESHFLAMSDDEFAAAFGTEWFIASGVTRAPDAPFATDLFSP